MSKKEYDKSHWHYVQAPDEVSLLRQHFYDDDTRYLLRKWLGLGRPNLRIVEMGSGGGFFTEQLLKIANTPRIICVEPDKFLLEYAKRRLGDKVVYKEGYVENPPLPDKAADLVLCHFLLCIVPDIRAAVDGMVKVTKPGGIVCAIEPRLYDYFTADPRAKVIVDGFKASGKGAWKLRRQLINYGADDDPKKKYGYPKIFTEYGLINIEVRAIGTSFYSGDRRRTNEDIVRDNQEWLRLLNNHEERYKTNLKRQGWKDSKIEEFFKTWREYHTEVMKNPQKDRDYHNLTVGCLLVIIGQKK